MRGIGGDGATLTRFAAELGVVLHLVSGATTVHCEVVRPDGRSLPELASSEDSSRRGNPSLQLPSGSKLSGES